MIEYVTMSEHYLMSTKPLPSMYEARQEAESLAKSTMEPIIILRIIGKITPMSKENIQWEALDL